MSDRRIIPAASRARVTERIEAWTETEVHRSELKKAPYNPRKISVTAKRRLRRGLKTLGLLQPIVWNKRTGNIVGGHQRLGQIDMLYGTPDYKLRVAAVELTDKQEREANVLLNNPNVMGEWEEKLLAELVEGDFDAMLAGFDDDDLAKILDEPDDDAPDQSSQLQTSFDVIITCDSEDHQVTVLEECAEKGWQCRALT